MSRHQITPAWQTSRGALVRASGCAVGVPVAGAKVFGETRQNLWSNPSGTKNGVTATPADGGALTISGTASQATYISMDGILCIKPGSTVSISADKASGPTTFGFYLNAVTADGTETVCTTYNSGNSTGVVPSDATSCNCGVFVASGATVNTTVRVMLAEGSEPEPWCPPGLSSVSELGVVSAGNNLAALPDATKAGITLKTLEDGSLSVSGTSTGQDSVSSIDIPISPGTVVYRQIDKSTGNSSVDFQANFLRDDNTQIEWYSAYPDKRSAVAPPGTAKLRIQFYVNKAGIEVSGTFKLLVTLDPDAEWEPAAAVTTTPIDLSGHQLRSLPNGTRDVLTVDGSGAVSVEQAVNSATFDGSSDENWVLSTADNGHGIANFSISVPDMTTNMGLASKMCNTLPVSSALQSEVTSPCVLAATGTFYVCLYSAEADTVDELRTWLAAHPTTIVYNRVAPQTIPLDPIAPPSIPAADATLWADTDVPCDLEATTWTASGAEQGRQQAAMIKVAQQVRQQAETVAALAAQSLEA